jgi:hypothetical protein
MKYALSMIFGLETEGTYLLAGMWLFVTLNNVHSIFCMKRQTKSFRIDVERFFSIGVVFTLSSLVFSLFIEWHLLFYFSMSGFLFLILSTLRDIYSKLNRSS